MHKILTFFGPRHAKFFFAGKCAWCGKSTLDRVNSCPNRVFSWEKKFPKKSEFFDFLTFLTIFDHKNRKKSVRKCGLREMIGIRHGAASQGSAAAYPKCQWGLHMKMHG